MLTSPYPLIFQGELDLGRIAGPFSYPPFEHFICSFLALREKSTTSKYKLLHNLSYPYENSSANFNIPDLAEKVSYAGITDASDIIYSLGPYYLSKSDIAEAF